MRKIFTSTTIKKQDSKKAGILIIPNKYRDYLTDAFSSINEFCRRNRMHPVDSNDAIRNLCTYIKSIPVCNKWALNPNDNNVQNMVYAGESINDIWNHMIHDHSDSIEYVSKDLRDAIFQKIDTDTSLSISEERTIGEILDAPYSKNLKLLFDLFNMYGDQVIAMIDLLHSGYLLNTLESIVALQNIIIEESYLFFINGVDSSKLLQPCMTYIDQVNEQIKNGIRIISLYSDGDNISENISECTLKRHVSWLKRISERDFFLCNRFSKFSIVMSDRTIISYILPKYECPDYNISCELTNDSDMIYDIHDIFHINGNKRVSSKNRYSSMTDLFMAIEDKTYIDYKELKANDYLITQTDHSYENILLDLNAHMIHSTEIKYTEIEYGIINKVETTRAYYSPATQKSFKKPLGTKTRYEQTHRNCSAMYRAHIIDKNILGDNPSMRFAQSISDLKPIGDIVDKDILKKHAVEIADMEDRTNGFQVSPFYATDEYGDIDRSSWEPRRNNWNQ